MPIRPARSMGAGAAELAHRKCYGWGILPSCAKGICVPTKLANQWESQLTAEPDRFEYIRAFVADVCRGITGAVGDDPFNFWRAHWQHRHGTQAPAIGKQSNGDATTNAARRLAQKYEREAQS